MNMSVERQGIANQPDYNTIILPPNCSVITTLQEIVVQLKIIFNSMP